MSGILLNRKRATIIECLIIIGLALIPLFVTFPYRVNIFLSWEGAYRLSQGQMPYRDFGTPLGIGFWLMPALFFKLFGPAMISLVKAQVALNIMSGFAFRSIQKSLNVNLGVRVLAVLVFALSYSFFNFWPWYNHTVIVYELVGIAFLLAAITNEQPNKWRIPQLLASAFFLFLSFFTKQDGGGLALLLALALVGYHVLQSKKWKDALFFLGFYFAIAIITFKAFAGYGIGYWFNHGQPPHNSRLSIGDILAEILGQSQWIKFYVLLMVLLLAPAAKNIRAAWNNRPLMFLTLVTLGILAEAAIFQVTSYTPPDNNIFFHAFAFAFIMQQASGLLQFKLEEWKPFIISGAMVLLWWSGSYWKYLDRVFSRFMTPPESGIVQSKTGENVISRNNFMLSYDSTDVPTSEWVFTDFPEFKKIYMPKSTVDGMQRFLAMPEIKGANGNAKVLNMTELTPLASITPFKLETGNNYPLWYHLGVGMFNKQLDDFNAKVRSKYYDVVLYEYAPYNNNFYPFSLRDELKKHYRQVDTFLAPRRPTNATIEVYAR
ncbi:hypothetical protein MKQ70_08540 [Chitinophaga sedimenti]|uniref:hypothetical protein n=1 Tax=Chitinophaga sedimenti TaxID=2033606 RepID=UPI002004C7F3|nr:hypothetical protein [Chitinophaga sedimenti]MCK7555054.1 hypothetical protein [Chitinophaga sedimenti]